MNALIIQHFQKDKQNNKDVFAQNINIIYDKNKDETIFIVHTSSNEVYAILG